MSMHALYEGRGLLRVRWTVGVVKVLMAESNEREGWSRPRPIVTAPFGYSDTQQGILVMES